MWTTEHSAVAGAGADDVWNLYADEARSAA